MISYGEYSEKFSDEKSEEMYYQKYVNQGSKMETLINKLDTMQPGMD